MKNSKKHVKKIKIRSFYWAVWFYVLILVNSVMAFGFITYYDFNLNSDNAIYMLAMIPLMGLIVGLMLKKVIGILKRRMERVLNGINEVAEGNLDVELDLKDAGEYKLIYENFNKMVHELKGTKMEMQNFANDFSHEFKTPITSIKGFAELLLDTEVSKEDQKQYHQIIAEESARLAELSQNTLLLSKLEAEQVVTDKKQFALDEQIKKCVIVLFHELEKKHIKINMELCNIKCFGNEELICQIWMNLINNAIKFTPENGDITIIMTSNENFVTVDITDSGVGMKEETIQHIFKKYYQADTSHATKGYGLGLSIVERIVTLCDGKISVTSVPGSGSTFTTILPVVNAK